jgi:hypothetical protein
MRAVAISSACALLSAQTTLAFMPHSGVQTALRGAARSASSHSRRATPLMARKPFIAGNWKLNPATVDDAVSLAKAVSAPRATRRWCCMTRGRVRTYLYLDGGP